MGFEAASESPRQRHPRCLGDREVNLATEPQLERVLLTLPDDGVSSVIVDLTGCVGASFRRFLSHRFGRGRGSAGRRQRGRRVIIDPVALRTLRQLTHDGGPADGYRNSRLSEPSS